MENNNTKNGKKKKEGINNSVETDYVVSRKSLSFYSFSMKLPPARWSPAALTELLTVKKQCKRIFHGNKWMKEHNYAFQNADTRPRLQSRTQNICFVISISAVILKRMVKNHIHFRLIQVLKNSIAWHFLTFTSPSSKLEFVYPPCCGVEEQMLIFSSGLTPGRVKGSWIEIQSPS